MSEKARGAKPRKEAFFIQVESAGEDKTPVFFNASRQLGKPMPYTKPLATCALRVTDTAVLFSMLKLYTKTRQALTQRPLAMPPGPLARLERRVASLTESLTEPLTDTDLFVEVEETLHRLVMTRDENGVVELDMADEVKEPVFELPRTALQITLFLRSPKTGRTVAVGWIGYQAKPGSPETLTRAVAFALNHLSGLAEFQILSGVVKAKVPAPPGRFAIVRPTRKADEEVRFSVPVRLWDGEPVTQVGVGEVQVQVDLETANPVTGRLLFSLVPSESIAAIFENYRGVFDQAVSTVITNELGAAEIQDIVCDIALGDVGAGTVERLKDAAAKVTGFDLTPRQYVLYAPTA